MDLASPPTDVARLTRRRFPASRRDQSQPLGEWQAENREISGRLPGPTTARIFLSREKAHRTNLSGNRQHKG
jgi:hypothetical protein